MTFITKKIDSESTANSKINETYQRLIKSVGYIGQKEKFEEPVTTEGDRESKLRSVTKKS